MTVLSEDSDEPSRINHPRKKARLSRHSSNTGSSLDHYQVVTSSPEYLNSYMDGDFPQGVSNGCNFPESPSLNQSHHNDTNTNNSDFISPIATLCNLGNTCFLNSVLYTLRFAPSFIHNLHHLVEDINVVTNHSKVLKGKSSSLSRLGSTMSTKMFSREPSIIPEAKMQCTSQLHEVFEELRRNEASSSSLPDPVPPTKFMQSLRAVNSMFEGNHQHDAHELYIFLLDNLRETSKDVYKFASQYNLTSSSTSLYQQTFNNLHTPLSISSSPASTSPTSSCSTPMTSSSSPSPPESSSSSTKRIKDKIKKKIKRFRPSHDSKKSLKLSTNSLNDKHYDSKFDLNGDIYSTLPSSTSEQFLLDLNNITEDFQGVSIIRTICSECEHVKERKEAFCDICVPIVEDKISVDVDEEMANKIYRSAIVTEEMLIESNKYWCEECLRYNEAKRCYRFETMPRLLTLHLKRFSSSSNSVVSKVSEFMPTPFVLKCFCEMCLNSKDAIHSYELYGVIMHLGSTIASGHYVSYVKATDNSSDYIHCPKDKRRMNTLIANEIDKVKGGSFLKLFKSNKSQGDYQDSNSKAGIHSNSSKILCRSSLDCCGIRIREKNHAHHHNNKYDPDMNDAPVTWLECDDESVRTLPQAQFEDMLMKRSLAQGTPYLLFYTKVCSN